MKKLFFSIFILFSILAATIFGFGLGMGQIGGWFGVGDFNLVGSYGFFLEKIKAIYPIFVFIWGSPIFYYIHTS